MLHKITGARLEWILFATLTLGLGSGCRQDTSTPSKETEAYLADYEPPANGKWGFLNMKGDLAIDPVYDDVNPFSEGLAAVNQGGKWGYVDKTGKLIIPLAYKSAWSFHEHRARVRPFENKDCFIDLSGRILSSESWEAAGDFSEGLALVSVGNTFGYIDSTGRMLLQPVYSRGSNFHHGLAVIDLEEKTGVINAKGELLIPATFDRIIIHHDEQIILCNDDNASVAFDFSGKELARLEHTLMLDSDGKLVSTTQNGLPDIYDLASGKNRLSSGSANIIYLGSHRWAIKQNKVYNLFDEDVRQISQVEYDQINQFRDGIAVYGRDHGWGYLDIGGKELTGNIFKLAWDYKDGLARAAFEHGIAFINRQQDIAFYPPPGTLDMRDFSEGMAPVLLSR